MLKRFLSQIKQKIDRSFNQFVASIFVATQLVFPVVLATPVSAATGGPNGPSIPVSENGVTPTLYEAGDDYPGGNVSCSQLGYSSGTTRNDYDNNNNDDFDDAWPAGLTVTTDGTYVDWNSTFEIGAVIVKGGSNANVYEYNPEATGDENLASPNNAHPTDPTKDKPYGLSNLTFCYNEEETKTTVEVIKKLVPSDDEGLFDLGIEGNYVKTDASHNDTTGKVEVDPDQDVSVREKAGTDTSLSDYTTSVECRDEGGQGTVIDSNNPTGEETRGLNIEEEKIDEGDDIVCVFTNTRTVLADYCDPTQRPDGMSIAQWLRANQVEGSDCFEYEVVNECGFMNVTLTKYPTKDGWAPYSAVYTTDGSVVYPANSFPANFAEDENGGSVEVTWYIVGPESDYLKGSDLPNFWDGEGLKVTVDTDCEEPRLPKLIVKKVTLPHVSDEEFDFKVWNNKQLVDEFELDTNWQTQDTKSYYVTELQPGSVSILEKPDKDWATKVYCHVFGGSQENAGVLNFGNDNYQNFVKEYVDYGQKLFCTFVNIEKPDIEVIKYHDIDQDGRFDKEEEPTLPDWKFFLDKKDEQQQETWNFWNYCYGHDYCDTTDSEGEADFKNLKPFGTYELSEKIKHGWTQSDIDCFVEKHGRLQRIGYLDGYNEYKLRDLKPGSDIKCFVGNHKQAEYSIEKSNDATDALLPGQTVNFMITVTAPEDSGIIYDAKVYDLMPQGLSYVANSWSAVSSVDGDQTGSVTPQPDYSGPGEAVWSIGDLSPGEVITLTYTAIVDENTPAGTYTNVAWTDGCEKFGRVPLLSVAVTDNINGEYGNPRCDEGYEQVFGNCDTKQEETPRLLSVRTDDGYPNDEPKDCDPFVESSVTVAAVLGETETEVLAETGTPAILAPFVGLTLAGTAVLLGGGGRRLKRLLGRFNQGLATGLMTLALMIFAVSPAMAATNSVWKLKVADLANTTTASALDLSFSVASTDSTSSTTVTLEVDGPGSNDQNDSEPVEGSESKSFEIELPVTGEYEITVSATGSGTLIGDGVVAQTVTRENPPEPTVITSTGTSVTQSGNTHTVAFTVPAGSDAETVQIYASTDPNSEGELVGEIPATPGALQTFVHNAANAAGLFFTIRLVDGDGNTSTLASNIGSQDSSAPGDDGVVSEVAATDDQTADDDEGQEQAATDDQSEDSNNTALVIIGLAAVAGALYYVFGRRSGIEE